MSLKDPSDITNIDYQSRVAIRKLIKTAKYYAQTRLCDKDCLCEDCKSLRYAKCVENKLTYIIDANKRCRQLVAKGTVWKR